jgi:hypothetical protein
MDANTLRREIVRCVGEHEATGSSAYVADKELATTIGVPLVDVQRQIRILESNGFLDVAATFGPTYAVRLTAQGEVALEDASRPGPPPGNPVGF